MADIQDHLAAILDDRKASGHFRALTELQGTDFCSNDYLDLGRETHVVDGGQSGSTGSRLISGNSQAVESFESDLAAFFGFQSSLLFSTGYAANAGLLACIARKGDVIITDALIHASLIDGARLSYAEKHRFNHNDVDNLEALLKLIHCDGRVFVVVESVYSMDGDIAPLAQIAALCKKYDAALIVDEAHSVGVYGQQGRGLVAHLGLQDEVLAVTYTFGKAMGAHGAVIAGSNVLRDYLINFCRTFIFSTAPSPQSVASLAHAFGRMKDVDDRREKLLSNIAYFVKTIKSMPLKDTYWLRSESAIQGLVIPEPERAMRVAERLYADGFAVKAIRAPSVPAGQERLRICLHAHNTQADIDHLAECLTALLSEIAA